MTGARRRSRTGDTTSDILDIAERLVQTRGFNGFSYADVASELSVTKASLHYHFPGKAELGEALISRYTGRFADALAEVDARGGDPRDKLDAYAGLYADVLRGQRMCLCGMLAAEYETLPGSMREAVIHFFDVNEAWLGRVLAQGRREGKLTFSGSAKEAARLIVGGLEGAMLVARAQGDTARFRATAERLVASFAGASAKAAAPRGHPKAVERGGTAR
ncbi:MAG: TetR/AcrR family transcriptional regulator [Actinobacteria bacterium]|nr:TetR/AcrR family transcriptional regulator [Actinomycetota bacterium]